MKKIFLVLASQLFVANLLFSQITFEKSYQRLAQEEAAQSVIEDGSGGYIVATGGKYTSASFTRDLGLAHLNAYGDTLWYTSYAMSYHPIVREVRKSQDAYYLMGLADDSSLNQTYMFWLQKFDLAGNSLWLKNYSIASIEPNPFGLNFQVLENGNLFCTTGWVNYFVIDTSGTILNSNIYNYYLDAKPEFIKHKLFQKDSTFYFIKQFTLTPPSNTHPKFFKLNENADSVGSFKADLDTVWGNATIHKMIGSNYLITGSVPFVSKSYTYISVLDSMGDKIWIKKISFLNTPTYYYTSYASLLNGVNIIAGFPVNNAPPISPPKGKAFLYCFNDNGDSLWYKEFRGDTLHKTEFYDVIATSDTGILAIGQILMPDSSRQSYIVKLDADGNLFNPLNAIEGKKETYLHLYPNPATDYINIHYLGIDKNAILSVSDLMGQTLFTQSLTSQDERIKVNTSLFAKGFYFCNITANGKLLASKKLIIVK